MEDLKTDEKSKQYLTFKLANEIYGIEVGNVREVFEYSSITKVPKVPGYIKGIINLRGEIIPVIDLNMLFFGKSNEITRLTCTVIIELGQDNNDFVISIMIDAINSVIDIPLSKIESKPDFGALINHEYLDAIGKVNDDFIILLNIHKVLNLDELSNFSNIKNTNLSSTLISEK